MGCNLPGLALRHTGTPKPGSFLGYISRPVAEEKREDERLPILGELRGEIVVLEPMAVREIGRGGAQVETRFPLQLDSLHDLRLTLGERSVVLKGRVVHSHISDVFEDVVTYRSGLEFVEMPARVADAILEFLDEIRTSRRAV
jgi:hypothetical protein